MIIVAVFTTKANVVITPKKINKQRKRVEKYWPQIHDLPDRAVHLIAERIGSTSFTHAFVSRIFFVIM